MLTHKKFYIFPLIVIAILLSIAWILSNPFSQSSILNWGQPALDLAVKEEAGEYLSSISTGREAAQRLSEADLFRERLGADAISTALALQMGKPYVAGETYIEGELDADVISAALALQMGKPYVAGGSHFEGELDADVISAALALQMGKPYVAGGSHFEGELDADVISAALALQMGIPYVANK
ncbi:MAG: hypothetical protein ACFFES_18800 [Candidatus Thorarchaeota archaeon]